MSLISNAELNVLRIRTYGHNFSTNSAFDWNPLRDGSVLRVFASGAASPVLTLTFGISGAIDPATGMLIWVIFEQTGTGGATITWPSVDVEALFQTPGDAIPNPNAGAITVWQGLKDYGFTGNFFMTKLGEW